MKNLRERVKKEKESTENRGKERKNAEKGEKSGSPHDPWICDDHLLILFNIPTLNGLRIIGLVVVGFHLLIIIKSIVTKRQNFGCLPFCDYFCGVFYEIIQQWE